MGKTTARDRRNQIRKRKQLTTRLVWGGAGVIVVGLFGWFLWSTFRPQAGESIPIMPNSGDHIPTDSQPSYSTDPPTSGPHYGNSLPADFYNEADLASLPPFPEGFLVHNLEHGHVILWYNCDLLNDTECDQLKSDIQEVMDSFNGFKVVAFPWKTIQVPLVLTSWGRVQEFSSFDSDQVTDFITRNRNRAPEPNAP